MFLKIQKAFRLVFALYGFYGLGEKVMAQMVWNRHVASRWAHAVTAVQTAWMKHVEGPYLALHHKSRAFRISVQAGSVFGVIIATAIGFYGLLAGLAGMGGITLSLIGADSPISLGTGVLLLMVGIAILMLAAGLVWLAITFMNYLLKQTLLGLTLMSMGLYMAWFALGVLGLLSALNLDPFGVFRYAGAEGVDAAVMGLIVLVGTMCAGFGVLALPVPQFARALATTVRKT